MVDDYRILLITKPSNPCDDAFLVLWDTSQPQPLHLLFEMPSSTLDVAYVPQQLLGSAPIQAGIGLHRTDPDQRIVGVVCRGSYGDIPLDDDYMIIISATDLRAHASSQTGGEHKICWDEWQSSTTIVRVNFAITTAARISGSRFFAAVRGVSYTTYATLLRIYDFSPGARGRRNPDRSPVLDLMVNAARVLKKVDNAVWDFSEDNLLMFNVSNGVTSSRVYGFLVNRSDFL